MPNPVLTAALERVASRSDLSSDDAKASIAEIMAGRASEIEIAGLLMALRTKGVTPTELAGFVSAMRSAAVRVESGGKPLVDTAGTGGGQTTFNISTAAALIAAAAGAKVAKHGNRSSTSRSGSADVLEALGVRIDLGPEAEARLIDELGFGFMFAPLHHSGMRHAVPVRKELGVRTVFNLLGPLCNPAGARRQLIGVGDPDALKLVAGALVELGTDHALVVSSQDGLDELSIAAPTDAIEVKEGALTELVISPEEVGVQSGELSAIAGGEPSENAAVIRSVFAGKQGPALEISVLNAGAAIYVAGIASSIEEGVVFARQALESGAAARTLDHLVELSSREATAA